MEHFLSVVPVHGIVSKNPASQCSVQFSLGPRQYDSAGHTVHTLFLVAVHGVVSYKPSAHVVVHAMGFTDASGQ